MSLEAWGDEGDVGPEGYVTDERAAEMVQEAIEECALMCDREADRQSAYEGGVRDRGLKATHAAVAMILMAVAQRIRELKASNPDSAVVQSGGKDG